MSDDPKRDKFCALLEAAMKDEDKASRIEYPDLIIESTKPDWIVGVDPDPNTIRDTVETIIPDEAKHLGKLEVLYRDFCEAYRALEKWK